jgi:replicative DNA helicase
VASVEQLVISKILEEQSLSEAAKSGIKPVHFAAEWEEIFLWVMQYNQKHSAVPSVRAFGAQYGDVDIVDTHDETFSGLFEELMDAYRKRVMVSAVAEAMPKLESDDIAAAMEMLSKGLQKASTETTRLRDVNFIDTWEERYAKYEYMRAHPNELLGIPTGFVGLDKITQGLRKQQFVVMAGEPKRGKSIIAMIIAQACHIHGLRPALISFEMSAAEQASRYDALMAKVSYTRILNGDLSEKEMERIKRSMILRKNMQPFMVSEDSSSLTTLSALAGKIQEYQPDLLIVDGMYLMDDENGEVKGSPQALTNISRGMKRLCQRFDIPILGTTQVLASKVQNKRTRAVTGDSLGYTSAFLQDTDLLLGVERNPDIDNQAIVRVVESRSSARGEVHVQWDWETMEFEEIFDEDLDELDPSYD